MAQRDNNAVFAAALTEQLARHGLRQKDLAKASGVSAPYISRLTNDLTASPEWCDKLADALKASDEERMALHRAAARSKGYKI